MTNLTYLVTSDLHGDGKTTRELLEKAISASVDGVIITGDLCPRDTATALALTNLPFPLYIVRGNSDSPWDFKDFGLAIPQAFGSLERDDGIKIAFTHGHIVSEPDEIMPGLERNDIVITGHTHVPHLYRDRDGIIRLNPGSPVRPRSREGASYAFIYRDTISIMSYPSGRVISTLDIRG